MKRLLLVLLIFASAAAYQIFGQAEWHRQFLQYDASGYYLYLPAVFIYNDLGQMAFYPHIDSAYQPSPGGTWYSLYPQSATGRRLNKYPLGLSIGELPFFAAGHVYAKTHAQDFPADGYSLPYRVALAFAALAWTLTGLFFLERFLSRFASELAAAITVAIIGFGTNLYCYTVTNFGMAHAYLFMLFAIILYCTLKWHKAGSATSLYGIAVAGGLVTITRPVDAAVLLFPLLWNTWSKPDRKHKWTLLKQSGWHLPVAGLVFVSILALQMIYWKWTTGHFIYFSYEGEGFDFSDPEIFRGLFGWGKGWFVYTPLALVGLSGLIPLFRRRLMLAVLVLLYFVAVIYIVFSWHEWWYGWTFGCRPLIESLAVLSIPLAALMQWLLRRKLWITISGGLVIAFFIWLNIYQTNQYLTGALPGNGVTKAYYWRVWNRMHAEDEDKKLLH